MATQQAGLFTQGPSVDDLLQQRNKRSMDLQQSLMQQAAQGSRTPAKARAISLLGSSLGRALGGAVGGQDTEMEKLKARNATQQAMQQQYSQALVQGTPEEQLKQGQALINAGYSQHGSQLVVQGQQGLKEQKAEEERKKVALAEQQRREATTAQAAALGLDSTVELLKNGGDVDEAAKVIREQETLKVAQKGGRKGRVVLAQNYGSSASLISGISSGKYDQMSDTTFLKMLEGKEAKLTHFKTPEGTIKPFRVDKGGKVFDRPSNTWVFPSELNLSAAPQLTQEVETLDAITKAMIGVEVENFATLSEKANDAVSALDVNNVSQKIFDQGVISGALGNFSLQARKLLMESGLSSEESDRLVANSEAYFAQRGMAVANVIKNFGSGTGLSDADREYARQIVGGEITLDKEAISKLLQIERKSYLTLINNHNKVVDRLGQLGSENGEPWEKAKQFYIEAPVFETAPTVVPLSSSAQQYLNG